jgi:phosphoglycolate phosphatase
MTGVKGVIFDKDGTLFDFASTWEAWAETFLLRLCGNDRSRAADVGDQIGFDLASRTFDPGSFVIAGTPGELVDVLQPLFPDWTATALENMLNEEAETAPQSEAVPLKPFLSELRRRGLKLGVATNDAERPARAHLVQAGVTGLFDFIAGYDSGFGAKPAPGQLLAFCEVQGIRPEQTIMVGDSTHDLHAGRAAGMRTVAVLTGMAGQAELAPYADVVLPDIGHLPDWLPV